jgi:hypothetical protein
MTKWTSEGVLNSAVAQALGEMVASHGGELTDHAVTKSGKVYRRAAGDVIEVVLSEGTVYLRKAGDCGAYAVLSLDAFKVLGEESTLPEFANLKEVVALETELRRFELEFDATFGLDEPELTYTPAEGCSCHLCDCALGIYDRMSAQFVAGCTAPILTCHSCHMAREESAHVAA